MEKFRLIVGGFIFTMIFAVSAFAQAQAPVKIALVDTGAFYDQKDGIAKVANAYKSLDAEFKPTTTELENGAKRFQSLQGEIQALQTKANDPANKVPIDRSAAQAKLDEAEKLQRDLKFKQEEFKAQLAKRESAVVGPLIQDVGKALTDYAKQKGYALVFDVGKLVDNQMILYWQEGTEITKDFIQYYNARPAGTATKKPE